MTLGEIIGKYREEQGLSQRQFAMRCGISNGYISMIEKNKNPATGKPVIVSLDKLKAIASAMGMTADELMRITDGETRVSLEAGEEEYYSPKTIQASIVSFGMDQLPEEEREKILGVLQAMYANNPALFRREKGDDNDP